MSVCKELFHPAFLLSIAITPVGTNLSNNVLSFAILNERGKSDIPSFAAGTLICPNIS